jgi:hypothetical protein
VLDQGVVYISIQHAIAVHACACGCGTEVPTPFSPSDWKLTFDGDSVTLAPSIGNWELPCQSHYWIRRNQVRWIPGPRFPSPSSSQREAHPNPLPAAQPTTQRGRLRDRLQRPRRPRRT